MATTVGTAIGDGRARPGGGWVLVAITVLAAFYRTPGVLLHGRFWAEEGSTFGQDLIGADLLTALTYVYKGTVQVLTAVPVWAALHLSLDRAPLLTTWYALGVQIVFALHLGRWARGAGIDPRLTALALAALLLHLNWFEISLSATNVQWVVGGDMLVVAMMSAGQLGSRLRPLVPWVLLCGLTGVPADMIAPAFLVRGRLERSRPHLVLGLVLLGTAVLQIMLILTHPLAGRQFRTDPYVMAVSTAVQTVWVSVAGLRFTHFALMAEGAGWKATAAGLLFVAGAAGAVAVLAWRAWRHGVRPLSLAVLIGTWLGVCALNVFGAISEHTDLMHPLAGARYFTCGNVAGILLLLLAVGTDRGRWSRVGALFLVWMIVLGVVQPLAPRLRPSMRLFWDGPDWRAELARCRATPDRTCTVTIWPVMPPYVWDMRLPPAAFDAPARPQAAPPRP